MEEAGHTTISTGWRVFLGTPITEEELKAAVGKGACNKAPGRDDICLGLFKVNWDNIKADMLAVFNQMFLDGRIMEKQRHGTLVCIMKTDTATTLITVLNTHYKILARIVANRLRSTLSEVLHSS